MSKKDKETVNNSHEIKQVTKEKKKVLRQTDLPKVSLEEAIQDLVTVCRQFYSTYICRSGSWYIAKQF